MISRPAWTRIARPGCRTMPERRSICLLVFLPLLPLLALPPGRSVAADGGQNPAVTGGGPNPALTEDGKNGALTPQKIEDLVVLGKVWGFLKYHHPRITSGQLPWDQELIDVLPEIMRAPDREETRRVLLAWLDRVGEPAPCSPCAELPDSIQSKARIAWIGDRSLLGREVSERLERVHRNRLSNADQRYVDLNPGVRNPHFYEQSVDSLLVLSDSRYRLLSLYRFWNIIEYWFPHRDIMEEAWDRVMAEFIPRLIDASTPETYRLALMALIARVHDSHANLWSCINDRPPGAEARLPLIVRYVEDRFVVTGYPEGDSTHARGLRPGDVIERLDGIPVDSLTARWRPYYGASNSAVLMRDLAGSIPWGPRGRCVVSGRRDREPFEVTLERTPVVNSNRRLRTFHDLPGEPFQLLTPEVAYLKLSTAKSAQVPKYLRAAEGAKCLIIDLRNYPSEFFPFTLGGHLIDRPAGFVCTTHGDLNNPGTFVWTPPLEVAPRTPRFQGSVAILVDECTESLAEFTAMALQVSPGAVVVGSTTSGADGNVSRIRFPGGYEGAISGIGIFYPDRSPTQRIGIRIDREVRPTIAGIRAGRDEVLEAAVEKVLGRKPDWSVRRMDR